MGIISDKFIIPPFSVLNAREGLWQKRKRAWINIGIKSEIGEDIMKGESKNFRQKGYKFAEKHNKELDEKTQKALGCYASGFGSIVDRRQGTITGTSIFDPVLCELMYEWFCPKGGQIVDPFAGGSVRGIVASMLSRYYWGCDLSENQIAANYEQSFDIFGQEEIPIKISSASMRQLFNGCDPEYIKNVCHATCCEGKSQPESVMITIHPSEELKIKQAGGTIKNGFLQPKENKKCCFKNEYNLCNLHATNEKPFGCIASPFTLNSNDTLIIRNRYRLLKCYNDGNRLPAYIIFKKSLELIFGEEKIAKLVYHLDNGGDDLIVTMSLKNYQILIDNDNKKHSEKKNVGFIPYWILGDSLDELENAPNADFIFSCPPYGNLEIYSDDPRDISNMDYRDFIDTMGKIVLNACMKLKDNRFACFVVSDFRDKKGFYHNFISDVITLFLKCGLRLYNECILVTAIGSLPIRITKQFESGRKIGKTHQNVLIFYKGDPDKIKNIFSKKIEKTELTPQIKGFF